VFIKVSVIYDAQTPLWLGSPTPPAFGLPPPPGAGVIGDRPREGG